jgi:DNA-binding response OmpR family regulator
MTYKILLAADVTSLMVRPQQVLERRGLCVIFAGTVRELFEQLIAAGLLDLIVLGSAMDGVAAASVHDMLQTTNRIGTARVLLVDSSSIRDDKLWTEIQKARQFADQIDTLLGRVKTANPDPVRCGPLIINPENHEVSIRGRLVMLSPTEIEILYYFVARAGELVLRDALLSAIWGDDRTVNDKILDVYMRRLRAVCRAETSELTFRTVPRMGYQLLFQPRRVAKGNRPQPQTY